MNTPQNLQLLDFAENDQQAGFRLHRFELYNWGTFNQQVWRFPLNGSNALLTGEIGSGKSTLVDAITTLLVPNQKIAYNKAAGAEAKERTLRSYVLGHYKSERSESGSAKPVALRDQNHYSVILSYFYNQGYDKPITLAQVFYLSANQNQPQRFYLIAEADLSIAQHFANFGSDISSLKKRLRQLEHVQLEDSFTAYSSAFCRHFGINDEQALELFAQTVSMKSVGNLTDFVREHMLEAFAVEQRIAELIQHFDNLNRAHEAVLKAKRQINLLSPLAENCAQHAKWTEEERSCGACRDALPFCFAGIRKDLLQQRLCDIQQAIDAQREQLALLEGQIQRADVRRKELDIAIEQNGGRQLEDLRKEIGRLCGESKRCEEYFNQYNKLAEQLQLPGAVSLALFQDNTRRLPELQEECSAEQAQIENSLSECHADLRELHKSAEDIESELNSLRLHRSNIPAQMTAIRSALCAALGQEEEELPFSGELLQVDETQRHWEGAIERVLHNFALSLLVPDALYAKVSEWAEQTALKGRLVYFRVRKARPADESTWHKDSLLHKLHIKEDSAFHDWLKSELSRRFDYACCETLEQLRREEKAISVGGQIKSGGQRHEKDDRHALHDRRHYVLGWDNAEKIALLEKQTAQQQKQIAQFEQQIRALKGKSGQLKIRGERLAIIATLNDFQKLDFKSLQLEIHRLEQELRELESQSDTLRTLQQQLKTLEHEIAALKEQERSRQRELGKHEGRQSDTLQQLEQARQLHEAASLEHQACFAPLQALHAETCGQQELTVESCAAAETALRASLQGKIDSLNARLKNLATKITEAMTQYRSEFPAETRDLDNHLDTAPEYQAMLQTLLRDGLPQFEQRFKAMLNENVIHEIVSFQSALLREEQNIGERIGKINESLQQIDYTDGRYIQLLADKSADREIIDFKAQLRQCSEGSLSASADEQYAENKFLQVRQIIDRLQGREGSSEADRRWMQKVCDVRNWFIFAASERWREDNSEYEHYSDSGGKSGGQKEKLAYTVLAASLAYRFGLEWGETRSRSFRFVVIDEAFGRGSDESARYGLELFHRLNLQLLIVTPLQKIHIIEPYVASVGYVHNEQGRESLLRCLSIEEYQEEKQKIKTI